LLRRIAKQLDSSLRLDKYSVGGLSFGKLKSLRLELAIKRLASLAIGAAGLIHLVLAPEHYAHAPAHGIFFALAGIAEILWALAFLRWPIEGIYYVGIVLAGAMIVISGLARA